MDLTLNRVNINYLGVVLDEKLNWRAHLRSLKSKLSQSCFVLFVKIEVLFGCGYLKWCIRVCFIGILNTVYLLWVVLLNVI